MLNMVSGPVVAVVSADSIGPSRAGRCQGQSHGKVTCVSHVLCVLCVLCLCLSESVEFVRLCGMRTFVQGPSPSFHRGKVDIGWEEEGQAKEGQEGDEDGGQVKSTLHVPIRGHR